MPLIEWKDEHTVNVKEIDHQHLRIVALVNQLHSSVEACIDKKELFHHLIMLVEYTRMHFSTEEKLMKQHAFPELPKHHEEHRMLLKYLDNLVASVSRGTYPTFYSDYDISSDWAMLHILEYDKDLGKYLNSKNIY